MIVIVLISVQEGLDLDISEKDVSVRYRNFSNDDFFKRSKTRKFHKFSFVNLKRHNSVSAKKLHINLLSSRPNILNVIN